MPFVLDSGAGVTCLHPTDAIRHVGIDPILLGDPMRWPGTETYEGIGGRVRYFLSPVRYRLLHDDARSQVVEGTLRIAPWSGEMSMIPSVLGWDLLRHFRVVLDWSLGLVELHSLSSAPEQAVQASPR